METFPEYYLAGAITFHFLFQVGVGWRKLLKKRATFLVALWTIAIPMLLLVYSGLGSIGSAIQSGEAPIVANNPILGIFAYPFAVLVSVLFRRRRPSADQIIQTPPPSPVGILCRQPTCSFSALPCDGSHHHGIRGAVQSRTNVSVTGLSGLHCPFQSSWGEAKVSGNRT